MSTHSSGSFGRTSRRDRAEKLQIEAEDLYSRAKAHSDSAAQLRREREGYEALRPSYRQLTPEQMGEYMAENVWGRNQAAGAEMAKSRELSRQAQTARSEAELEEELAFRIAYGDIPYREDYAEKSLPIPGGTKRGRPVLISSGARTGAYIDSGYDDIYYDIINGDADARNLEQSNDMALYGALQNHQYLYRLTGEERGIYNYLYQTDKAQAEKYLDGLTPYLYKRQAERETEDARASAEEDGLGASISSIVTKLDEGLSYLPQLGDVLAGNELDANAPYNRTVRRNSAIRETVANQWGPVGSFLYQTGMSMADFLFSMAASGGSAALNLAILGTGAAAETVWSLKNAGLDDTRAFILGTAAGAAEIFTEQTSLETLLNPELLADGLKKYILKNMLAEGSEELASDLLNWAADDLYDWIAGEDKSEWKQKLRYCEALGIDPQTAAAQLIRERLTTAGLDALGGSLSGLVLSGANAELSDLRNTQTDDTFADVGEYMRIGTTDWTKTISELTKREKNDIIQYLDESLGEPIINSVGAKSLSYPTVYYPDSSIQVEFVPGSRPVYPTDHTIAGKGCKTHRQIDDIDRLVETYLADAPGWHKEKARYQVFDEYGAIREVELHWYQHEDVGRIEYKVKTKGGYIYVDEWN